MRPSKSFSSRQKIIIFHLFHFFNLNYSMIFRFSSVKVIRETTHIGAFLLSAYLNIFYSLMNITEGNTAVHADYLIFCICIQQGQFFYSLVNKERTWLIKQKHKWINLDFNNIMNYKNNGWVSMMERVPFFLILDITITKF